MAVAFQTASSGHNPVDETEVTSVTFTHAVSSGTNLAMFFGASIEEVANQVTGATFNGVAATALGRIAGASFSVAEAFGLVAPTVTTANVVVSLDADQIMAGAISATGVDQTSPFGTVGTTTDTDNTVAITVGSVATGDLVVAVLAVDSNNNVVEGADQTSVWEYGFGNNAVTGAGCHQAGTAGGVMSYSWPASRAHSMLAVAFKEAGASTGATSAMLLRLDIEGLVVGAGGLH